MASKHERPEVALKAEINRLRSRPDPPPGLGPDRDVLEIGLVG